MKVVTPLIGVVAAALLLATPAHADSGLDQYLADLRADGAQISSGQESAFLVYGLGVCVDLFNGIAPAAELEALLGEGFSVARAQSLMAASRKNICPKAVSGGKISGGVGGAR